MPSVPRQLRECLEFLDVWEAWKYTLSNTVTAPPVWVVIFLRNTGLANGKLIANPRPRYTRTSHAKNFISQLTVCWIPPQTNAVLPKLFFPSISSAIMQVPLINCYLMAQNLAGKELNNSPDVKMTLSAEYFQPLNAMPFDGFFNLSYQYQSDVNFSLLADPGSVQDSYAVLNISMGIVEREHKRYEVTLFANNVTDERFVTGKGNVGGLWGGTPVYIHVLPREAQSYAGIRVGFNF